MYLKVEKSNLYISFCSYYYDYRDKKWGEQKRLKVKERLQDNDDCYKFSFKISIRRRWSNKNAKCFSSMLKQVIWIIEFI